jgi:hypothetical protein
MATELFKGLKAKDGESSELAKEKGDQVDIWRDVGGLQEADRTNMKLLAMTSPIEYAKLKSTAIEKVRAATEASYKSAFEQNIAAGVPVEEAKKQALKAAHATKDLQNRAMKLRFHDDDSIISAKGQVKKADAFKGLV